MRGDYFMVNWSKGSVAGEHMLVVRQAAVQVLTGVLASAHVRFTHLLCEGELTFTKRGVYGDTGGSYFDAAIHSSDGNVAEVTFFIPRASEEASLEDELIVGQYLDEAGNKVGEPITPDVELVLSGGLRIKALRSN